ncbi:MAG: chromosome segregation protein SMC [Gammaproteobacteria bacterium 39-13]|nr:chromosome segregation protein SMC [Gammaproteobacteria bacterium]OJV91859.1 MAG: chromosome segregation protein SMC [Gammaproteobacteria bacterium 39-13]
MRLSKIKLAGFKSFVDPTSIHFLSNLTAVAGPNGCGKSNVIDAVRWVMGESSAKHLRGGSLTDVIFSGSSARKPVGQATVELLFDNTEGKIGGEYAAYSEIAIKRQVTRDGQSSYFLNGQRCRRRDITDIFLGTGLGPRSYAIIEQGMISRVIDAKPEDLRTFIEEAAGVSKYKERRKETENRIQHTQDNLARLNDLRGELDNQLRHLQRQSQSAEKYKTLKAEESVMSAQLAALVWKRLDAEIKENEAKIRELITKLEEEQANSQSLKTEQEKLRLVQTDSNEALNEVQKRYYGVGGEIAKIEQAIQHHQERQQQLILDKQEAEQTFLTAQSQLEQDQANMLNLEELIAELEPEHHLSAELAEQAVELQQQSEMALETWREKTAELQQASIGPSRQADTEKAKITQLEKQIHQTQERMNRLEAELKAQGADETTDIEALNEKIALCQHQIENVDEQIEECVVQKEGILTSANTLRAEIKTLQHTLNEMQGQQAALAALQSSALGKDEQAKKSWLTAQNLEANPYVAQHIEVTSGWEIAVETVLGGFLEAIGIEQGQLSSLANQLHDLKDCDISLIEWQYNTTLELPSDNRLASCIKEIHRLPSSLYQLLASVHLCASVEEATTRLSSLAPSESIITPQGLWMGQGWVKVKAKPQDNSVGVLAREEKLKRLNQDLNLQQEKLFQAQQSLEEAEEKLKDIEFDKETFHQEKNKLHQEISTLQSEHRIKQNRIEQSQKRHQQIQQDLAECRGLIQQSQQEVHVSRSSLQEALEQMAQINQDQETLALAKGNLQEQVSSARIKVKETATRAQEIALKLQTYRTQSSALKDNLSRCQLQIENAEIRVKNIILAMEKNEDPIETLRFELETHLENRIMIEGDLNKARDAVAAVDNQLREIERALHMLDQKSVTVREQLEQTKMHWQALQVRCESALEKLKNVEDTIENILATMPSEANEGLWQQNIQEIEQKIHRLGAINLAAIEEYEAALQRKEYLDSQCNDLTEALTTLENAIKKIDKETKTKFKETFDRVNNEFTQLFPRLFGGGQASLTMTGDDLLETGITLMARPPGKKNSSIQQLSGGEKALTAVALVFSIFQLNPAPFCMLDEVDAPLDDNNVGRFCDLVKHMSKTVQFIYVSHNKLAIEMAEQLQGVTMREPGVSRLVTVDIEEAKSMAEA